MNLEGYPEPVARQKIKELDGLRGIAIIMVFFYHFLPRSALIYDAPFMKVIYRNLNIGWAGVDLFFVLSGFLITSNLLAMKSKERFFINFYGRRVLRIFPLYYLTLIGIFIVFARLDPNAMGLLGKYKIFYVVFAQNWIYALSMANAPEYMGQFWSLAIEEQFYIVWPILIYKIKNKTFLMINGAVIVAVLVYRLYVWYFAQMDAASMYVYFSTLTRIDTLVIGSSIAVLFRVYDLRQLMRPIRWLVAPLALIVIACAANNPQSMVRENPPMLTFGFTAIALLCGCVLILALISPEPAFMRAFLRSDLLSFFGKYSYAIYLFHMPILVLYLRLLSRMGVHGMLFSLLFLAASLGTSIVAALISWHGLEKHCLRLKRYFE